MLIFITLFVVVAAYAIMLGEYSKYMEKLYNEEDAEWAE